MKRFRKVIREAKADEPRTYLMSRITFAICFFVSVGLIVGGFFVPPMGVIDGSCLTAVGELLLFPTLLYGFRAVELGLRVKFQKGETYHVYVDGQQMSYTCTDVVCGNARNNTVFDVLEDGGMSIEEGACVNVDVTKTLVCDLFHNHIENEVTVSHVMMEGDGHAVFQLNQLYCFFNRFY